MKGYFDPNDLGSDYQKREMPPLASSVEFVECRQGVRKTSRNTDGAIQVQCLNDEGTVASSLLLFYISIYYHHGMFPHLLDGLFH